MIKKRLRFVQNVCWGFFKLDTMFDNKIVLNNKINRYLKFVFYFFNKKK